MVEMYYQLMFRVHATFLLCLLVVNIIGTFAKTAHTVPTLLVFPMLGTYDSVFG
jgi:hypothetical protein